MPELTERGVGESVAWLKSMTLVVGEGAYRPQAMSHVTPNEYRDHAERLVDTLAAEVERLRGLGEAFVEATKPGYGCSCEPGSDDECEVCEWWVAARAFRAALSLPTHTPEAE